MSGAARPCRDVAVVAGGVGGDHAGTQPTPGLLSLPDALLITVLQGVQWSSRAACRNLRAHKNAGSTELILIWPADAGDPDQPQRFLSQLPNLTALECRAGGSSSSNSGSSNSSSRDIRLCPLASCASQLASLKLINFGRLKSCRPLSSLPRLTTLDLSGCKNLRSITHVTASSKHLTSLDLSGCRSLDDPALAALAGLSRLASLTLDGCSRVQDLSFISRLPQLTGVSLADCTGVRDISPLAASTSQHLTSLQLDGCAALADVRALSALTSLAHLDLRDCPRIRSYAALGVLTRLTSLCLGRRRSSNSFNKSGPGDVSFLTACQQLQALELESSWVEDVSPLTVLTCLTSLGLSHCSVDIDDTLTCWLGGLRHVDFSRCDLESLSVLLTCNQLTDVNISGLYMRGITDISPLTACTLLTALDMSRFSPGNSVLSLCALASCRRLQTLDISANRCTDLSPLASCTLLTALSMAFCREVNDFRPLAACAHLASLNIDGCAPTALDAVSMSCPQLTDLHLERGFDCRPLTRLTHLTSLDLAYCEALTDLRPLSHLPWLASLSLRRCRRVADLSPLSACARLTSLDLTGCMRVRDVSPLASCADLASLQLGSWGDTLDLTCLTACRSLRWLRRPPPLTGTGVEGPDGSLLAIARTLEQSGHDISTGVDWNALCKGRSQVVLASALRSLNHPDESPAMTQAIMAVYEAQIAGEPSF